MTEVYTIQKGDTLTKIAREHYGLDGREAYLKALEIAKENNIANPDLIYAGASLNLFGLDEEEAQEPIQANEPLNTEAQEPVEIQEPENENCDTFKAQTLSAPAQADDNKIENTYTKLMEAQKQYMQQLAGIADEDTEEVKSFQFAQLTEENIKEDYINALLDLTEQDIKVNDKENENGTKDGVIDLDEFVAQQLAFYRDTFNDLNTGDEELTQSLGLQNLFTMYDIDKSGALEKNEIAFYHMTEDINFDTSAFAQGPAMFIDSPIDAEFDGIIDFDQMTASAYLFNENMKAGGTLYADIYNEVAEMIAAGIENRQDANKIMFKNRLRNTDKIKLIKDRRNLHNNDLSNQKNTNITMEKALDIAKNIIKKVGGNISGNQITDIAREIIKNITSGDNNIGNTAITIAQKIGKQLPGSKVVDIAKEFLENITSNNDASDNIIQKAGKKLPSSVILDIIKEKLSGLIAQ